MTFESTSLNYFVINPTYTKLYITEPFKYTMNVAGLSKEEVKIKIVDKKEKFDLIISGKNEKYSYNQKIECYSEYYSKDKVTAKYNNGMLEIEVGLREDNVSEVNIQ